MREIVGVEHGKNSEYHWRKEYVRAVIRSDPSSYLNVREELTVDAPVVNSSYQ